MSAFADLDWRRIDVTAIVTFGGVGTIDEHRHGVCREWLRGHGYAIETLDCRSGLAVAIPALGRMLCWEQQFGYALGPESRNLDALRDGFDFTIPESGGQVLEILGAEMAWREDRRWLCGLLAIAQEQSRQQLALGRRFFVLLVVPERSPLIGEVIEQMTVPGPFWSPCREVHEFVQ